VAGVAISAGFGVVVGQGQAIAEASGSAAGLSAANGVRGYPEIHGSASPGRAANAGNGRHLEVGTRGADAQAPQSGRSIVAIGGRNLVAPRARRAA
jgi:hypothetical protein